ncbi:FtsX-like permease family protein [Actinokineospora cianjurensis]|uniref:FtsX-like permease family protein n=1 Tax=Actinokineospora cianjurensis TaxID=585224 RepID=A0A421B8S2_9PSEU|nr:FtsX-like permease family protein [Actinokineospora cianjurensis]RLK60603.1 FtsX-like permease family protein [Actinokineospora cianjurensis]
MVRAWVNDFRIGVRLAISGGRTSLARFVLSTIGIGLAVAVLLLASSVGPILEARAARELVNTPNTDAVVGVKPTLRLGTTSAFQGQALDVIYLRGTGDTSPVPAGIPRLPEPGEMYVSKAFAALLADPLLRERFSERVIGVIDPATIRDPRESVAYVGSSDLRIDTATRTEPAYSFGTPLYETRSLDPDALLLLLLGALAVLIPVFIFLVSSTRIAGVDRDRRLSALRLVGCDNRQIRRIAAAESLVSSLSGLVLGTSLFLVGRQLADSVTLYRASVYPRDIVPVPWMAALVVLIAPLMAVFAAQFALRRTIIEPLGVVRYSKPTKRRLAWRFAVVALGVAILNFHGNNRTVYGVGRGDDMWAISIAIGVALVLLGVPALLPWVVEHVVGRIRGGPTSWQLAVRRLQLDSGTSSRVVSGVAVVLAGAIALQATFASMAEGLAISIQYNDSSYASATVYATRSTMAETERTLDTVPGVNAWSLTRSVEMRAGQDVMLAEVMNCELATLNRLITDCVDGKVYVEHDINLIAFPAGRQTTIYLPSGDREFGDLQPAGGWVVPQGVQRLAERGQWENRIPGMVLVTPGAIPQLPAIKVAATYVLNLDRSKPDTGDRLRMALAPLGWHTRITTTDRASLTREQDTFLSIRRGLLIGAVFTLLLAGLSLLVLAVEHIRERKRPLAVLAASGVPTGVLARSLLWQIAIPIALGVLIAVLLGIVLSVETMLIMQGPLVVDWASAVMMAGAGAGLVLLVSLLTLPFLRNATRLDSLRTE